MVRIADILKLRERQEKTPSKTPDERREKAPLPPSSESGPKSNKENGKVFRFSTLTEAGGVPTPTILRPSTPLSPYREGTAAEMEGPRRYVAEAIQSSEANQTANAQEIYQRAVALAQGVLEKAKTGEEIKGQEMHGVIEDIIRGLTFGNKELVNLACSETTEAQTDFLAAKMANKAILSVEIGIGKKINKSQLFQLGMAAFLSDLGVTQVLDVVTKKDILTPEDWEKIRAIPAKTVEILQKIPDLHKVVLTVAEEFRENPEDTSAQVQALQKMDPFSRIVALIDVFEALTHDRPYRARMMPHEAMRLILHGGGKKFEQETLRLLIDRVGLYPIGSWVKLSSKEFAKVVETNPGQPMRPAVKVLFDERGRSVEEPARIDLSKNLTVQILQPIAEAELQKLIKKNT
ncbi:MAG: hypothetical protein HY609_05750 [Deltaproteobacteria bacterium]|nr:hypothetical protein [Deltaproteobacteria bacterium]